MVQNAMTDTVEGRTAGEGCQQQGRHQDRQNHDFEHFSISFSCIFSSFEIGVWKVRRTKSEKVYKNINRSTLSCRFSCRR